MSGGPIFPSSVFVNQTNGSIFPNFFAGGPGGQGANAVTNQAPHDEGLGVMASLSGVSTFDLRFIVPPTVPSGTMKLRTLALANATTGAGVITVLAANVSGGGNPSLVTLTSQAQFTVAWTSGLAGMYLETKTTFNFTPAGSDVIVMAFQPNGSGWTQAAVSTWIPTLIWE